MPAPLKAASDDEETLRTVMGLPGSLDKPEQPQISTAEPWRGKQPTRPTPAVRRVTRLMGSRCAQGGERATEIRHGEDSGGGGEPRHAERCAQQSDRRIQIDRQAAGGEIALPAEVSKRLLRRLANRDMRSFGEMFLIERNECGRVFFRNRDVGSIGAA